MSDRGDLRRVRKGNTGPLARRVRQSHLAGLQELRSGVDDALPESAHRPTKKGGLRHTGNWRVLVRGRRVILMGPEHRSTFDGPFWDAVEYAAKQLRDANAD